MITKDAVFLPGALTKPAGPQLYSESESQGLGALQYFGAAETRTQYMLI